MKKIFHLVSIACISLCLGAGCAGTLEVKEHSGFLGDYSKLQKGPEGGIEQRYISPRLWLQVEISKLRKFSLARVYQD